MLPVVILTSSDEENDLIGVTRLAPTATAQTVDFVEFTQAAKQLGLYWWLMNRRRRHAGALGRGNRAWGVIVAVRTRS